MFKKWKCVGALLLLPCVSFACGHEKIEYHQAYVRAMAPGQHNAAAYMEVVNHAEHAVTINKISSSMAGHTAIHETKNEAGVAKMQSIGQLSLPAQSTTLLQPGGMHVMLMDVKQALKAGDKIDLTIEYADGSQHTIKDVLVKG